MKKKLLKTAAIASFLTAAGVVIPQADIFAADTPNTPHPSTLPSAQPSTSPAETQPILSEEGFGAQNINKKKVDGFAEYALKDISLDKNRSLNIETLNENLVVNSVEYINETNGHKHKLNVKAGKVRNSYVADTSSLVGSNYLLNHIDMTSDYDGKPNTNGYSSQDIYTYANGAQGEGAFPGVYLDRKDLYKYDNKTKIKNQDETKLPELGNKDYVVYSDKTQVGGNDVLKITIKSKTGLEKLFDKTSEKFYSRHKEGSETQKMYGSVAFVNHYREFPKDIILSTDKDGKTTKVSGSFDVENTIDSEGNDVLYLKNFKDMGPGHYYLKQLHDLDLTKGDLSNFEFDLNPSGKSVYRTDKAEQPKVEEPKVIKPVEPTFPKVELPEKPKTKILEQKVGDRKVSVHFDGTKIPETNFYAEEVKDKDELAELTKELKAVNPKYKLVNVYDLKLIDSLGNTVDSVGSKRTVTLTNTKGKSVVYYVYRDQNNKLQLEKLPTYDGGNGNIVTFEAEHFSKYALVEEQTDGKQPEGPRTPQPAKPEGDKNIGSNWNPFAQGQKAKEGSTEVKSEAGEVATKPVSNRKEGKALPNTGLQTTSYGFLAAIVGLFGAVALRRKNR